MAINWNHLTDLFHELVTVSAQEQQHRLREISNKDASLAAELQALLANVDETVDFTFAAAAEQILSSESLGPNSKLGRYRLIRKLGEGGMGIVFLAHREEDFEQQVAIKLGRMTLDPKASALFMRERQILADLNHPNIARLFDGGMTQTGTPFLVMEYIEGETIDSHCRNHELELIDILVLFQKICAGVSYAHQHLIIHRDIKPANIIVEAGGIPRLLDFGIAKVVTEDVAATLTVGQAMTPQYVSPEQVQGHNTTTLTDVYSLGLLLYELLTGRRAQNVNPKDLSGLQRIVIEHDPEPLARVLGSTTTSLSTASKQLRQRLPWQRDLQNILQRALAKDPARRYPSVSAFNADISRLLDGDPVEASGDSLFYRLGKLTRKYRYQFAGISLAVASMVLLVIGLSWATVVANQARDDAKRRLSQSEGLIGFMLGDLRQQLEPKVRLEILDSVGEKAMAYFASLNLADQSDEALAQTALALRQIGDVRISQGRFGEGEAAFQRSMELTQSLYRRNPESNQRLFELSQSHYWVGFAALRSGDYARARVPFVSYLELAEELVVREPTQLDWLLELSYAHNNLGTLDMQIGQAMQARKRFQQSLALKLDLVAAEPSNRVWQMELADTLGWLADSEHRLGYLEEALSHSRQRLTRIEQLAHNSSDSKRVNRALGYASQTLAQQLLSVGQVADARKLFEDAVILADQRVAFDPEDHTWLEDSARSRLELSNLLTIEGEFEPAHQYLDQTLALIKRLLTQHDQTFAWKRDLQARSIYQLALLFYQQFELEQAQSQIETVLTLLESLVRHHSDDLILIALYQNSLLLAGDIKQALCDSDAATQLWQQAISYNTLGTQTPLQPEIPFNLSLRTVVQNRLGQVEAADAGALQLAAMGYSNPWYHIFSLPQLKNDDCGPG